MITPVQLLTRDQLDKLPDRAREVVEYRKSGLSLNHIQGCPADCPYCIRHTYGLWDMRQPRSLMTDAEAVEQLVGHRYFQPHVTPLQIFNRATDPFLPKVRAHTFAVLEDLDQRGLTNHVLVISRYRVTEQDCARLNQLQHIKLTLLFTYSGIPDSKLEPFPSAVAEASLRTAAPLAEAYRTIFYWDPLVPGLNDKGEDSLGKRYRKLANQLARAWALASGRDTLADLRTAAKFYEEVRVWMGKFDAQERQASGQPVPEEIQRLLSGLVASSTATGEIVDIYEAAGLPKPSLSDLGPDFQLKAQKAEHPHLAIEALRDLLTEESGKATRHNLIRQRAFSERIRELMNKYTNQQLTSAEVIAELIEMAKEVAAEGNRGQDFSPPLSEDELAFYDAVSTNESAVELQGEEVLAQIARELVEVMRRDIKTDWTVRDDVRAKLRSSIKRLLVKYKYPPDKQPEAIKLVIEQMEAMAPRYAA